MSHQVDARAKDAFRLPFRHLVLGLALDVPHVHTSITRRAREILSIDTQTDSPHLTGLFLRRGDLAAGFPDAVREPPDLGFAGEAYGHGGQAVARCRNVVRAQLVCVLEDLSDGKIVGCCRVDLDRRVSGHRKNVGGRGREAKDVGDMGLTVLV